MKQAAEAFAELARVLRIFQVGGRRVLRFEIESSPFRKFTPSTRMNRHQRRRILAGVRRGGD